MFGTHRPGSSATRFEGNVIPTTSRIVPGISYAMVLGRHEVSDSTDYTDLPDLEEDDAFPALIQEPSVQSSNEECSDITFGSFRLSPHDPGFAKYVEDIELEAVLLASADAELDLDEYKFDLETAKAIELSMDVTFGEGVNTMLDPCSDYFCESAFQRLEVFLEQIANSRTYDEKVRMKYKRKNENRRMAKRYLSQMRALDDMFIQSAIEALPQTQAGGAPVKLPIRMQNRNALATRGVTAAEVIEFEKHRDFSVRLFSHRQVSRMYRDVLQIRSAKARLTAAKAKLDHKKENLRIARERAMARYNKTEIQTQGPGIGLRLLSGFVTGAAYAVAVTSIRTISSAIGKTSEKANSFLDTIHEQLKNLAKALDKWGTAIKLALYTGVVWYLWTTFDNSLLRSLLLASFPLFFGSKIGAFVSKVFQKDANDKSVLTQSFTKDTALPSLIALSVLYAVGIKGKPNLLAACVAAVGVLPRTIKGIECVLDFVIDGIEAVINMILKWFNRPEFRFRKQLDEVVDKAVKNAWKIDAKMQAADYDNKQSPQMYAQCMNSYAELVKLIALYHENVSVRMELVQVRNVMSGHCNSLKMTLGRGSGFRQEPLSILIESPPGKGKTMNIPVLIGVILKQAGVYPDLTIDTLHQAFFTRAPNTEYFDGYYGQECYYIDDVFAKHQNPTGITQFDEVMAFYGNVTTMLNMAECDKKGMFPFTSSLLLMTTNARTMASIGASAHLLCPDAFKRRIDIHLHMDVKPEFKVQDGPRAGQLDYRKYREELKKLADEGKTGFDAHPWYIWEAWETTFGEFEYQAGHGKCFSEFVPMFVEQMIYKRESHLDNMDHLRRVLQSGDKEALVPKSPEVSVVWGESECEISPAPSVEARVASIEGRSLSSFLCPSLEKVEVFPRKVLEPLDLGEIEGVMNRGTFSPTILKTVKDTSCRKFTNEQRLLFETLQGETIDYIPPLPKEQALCLEGVGGFANDEVNVLYDNKPPKADFVARLFGKEFAKRDLATYYSEFWTQHKALSVVMVLLAAFTAQKWIFRPMLSGLDAAFRRVFVDIRGEGQSNAPKPSNIIMKAPPPPQLQGPGDGLWKIVYDQTYKLVADTEEGYIACGQIIMIADCLALMPHHFISMLMGYIDDGTMTHNTVLYMKSVRGERIKMTINKFLSYATFSDTAADVVFINFDKGFRRHRNIIDFFMKESDYASVGGRSVRLDVAVINGANMNPDVPLERAMYMTPNAQVGKSLLRASKRSYTRYVQYKAATQFGDCGAPLSLTDYRYYNNRFLLGFHVAGTPATGEAFATLVPQELCVKAYDKFGIKEVREATFTQSAWPEKIVVTEIDEVPFTETGLLGTAKPLYSVDTASGVSIPVRSAMIKTQIGREDLFRDEIAQMNDGHEPPNLVPMKLGPYTDRSDPSVTVYPMEEATRPYVGDVFLPDSSAFRVGLAVAMRNFAKATGKFPAPVLSKKDAAQGKPELGLKGLTRSTSVGYPLCHEARDKRDYFGADDEMDFSSDKAIKLLTEIDMLEDLIREGYRPQFVCRDFLKDEVRKEGKCARLIAGTDLRYYILCRMYFGAFVGAVCRTHLDSGLCLGLNPTSEWGAIRRKLLAPDPGGKNVWDGDFAGFDSSQMPRLLWDCLDYINNWYSERGGTQEDNDIRTILFMDLVYSRHITGQKGVFTTIVEWSKSLPSGHFLTSTINSMISMGLIGAGYVGLTGRTDFSDTSAAIVQGDDNVVSTSEALVGVFNQVALSEYLYREFNMIYTAGRKGEELKPVIGIDEVVFLQRRFAVKNGYDVCPIRPESFLSSMYYVHTADAARTKEVLMSSVENAFEELSMHDEKYWKVVAPKLKDIKTSYDDAPLHSTLTSADYLRVVLSRVPSYV